MLALGTATSSAALLITFSQEGADVVMRATGSVDVSTGTFFFDAGTGGQTQASISTGGIRSIDYTGNQAADTVTGIDLLTANLAAFNIIAGGPTTGSGDFSISGERFTAYATTDSGIVDDNAVNATVTTSNRVVIFTGLNYADSGLDLHAKDTDIPLWKASAGAGEAGTVYFRVNSVPEPSSPLLMGLGCLALLMRRRKQRH
ncbi:MAG: PEP-CTERM sorting domain-containing protein [Luteolibacter sp.]